jgi:hypothetical protein
VWIIIGKTIKTINGTLDLRSNRLDGSHVDAVVLQHFCDPDQLRQRSGPHLAHHLAVMDPDGNVTNADCSGDLLVRLTSRSLSRQPKPDTVSISAKRLNQTTSIPKIAVIGSADRPSDPKTYITRRLDAEHCAFAACSR